MPIWVDKTHDVSTAAETTAAARAVNRMCELDSYQKKAIPDVTVRADIIAYASPDSTYAVTKKLFDEAKKSILIGIYDFRPRTSGSWFSMRWPAVSQYR
jgi:hypothetical protein